MMTLTKFMARSTWVAHAFEWEKLLKCHLKGKASKKLANGQNIDYSEKRKRPKGFICPCTGVKYHNIQTCLLVYAADSGERLQDHWSSGYGTLTQNEDVMTSNKCFKYNHQTKQKGLKAKRAYMCRWFDLEPLFLGRLRPKRLTSNQIASQHRISFAWRHMRPKII